MAATFTIFSTSPRARRNTTYGDPLLTKLRAPEKASVSGMLRGRAVGTPFVIFGGANVKSNICSRHVRRLSARRHHLIGSSRSPALRTKSSLTVKLPRLPTTTNWERKRRGFVGRFPSQAPVFWRAQTTPPQCADRSGPVLSGLAYLLAGTRVTNLGLSVKTGDIYPFGLGEECVLSR